METKSCGERKRKYESGWLRSGWLGYFGRVCIIGMCAMHALSWWTQQPAAALVAVARIIVPAHFPRPLANNSPLFVVKTKQKTKTIACIFPPPHLWSNYNMLSNSNCL